MATIEQVYVDEVYSSISEHFADTRFCVWDFVKSFLDSKDDTTKGIDIGCGNGKNMRYNTKLILDGFDNCSNFVEICQKNALNVKLGNCLCLPCHPNIYDYAMSIAVYHHMATHEHRLTAIGEMIRTLKSRGHGIFSVWSVENQANEKIKRNFKKGDNYVKWMRKRDGKVFQRYYYVFSKDMVEELMNNFMEQIYNLKIYNEHGNWVVEFSKK